MTDTPLAAASNMPRTEGVAGRVLAFKQIDSTNMAASRALLDGSLTLSVDGADVAVVAADVQTAGRGRLDHTWISRPRESFTVSFVVSVLRKIAVDESVNGWLQMIAGLSALDGLDKALEQCGAHCVHDDCSRLLKWPNDLVVQGLKLGGILAQMVVLPNDEERVAIIFGVGLNLAVDACHLPTPQSTSLQLHYHPLPDMLTLRDMIAAGIVLSLKRRLSAFSNDPQTQARALRDEMRPLCYTLGHRAVVHFADGSEMEGEAVELNADASLAIRDGDGAMHVVRTADVGVLADLCV